jgi:hypothetical protein
MIIVSLAAKDFSEALGWWLAAFCCYKFKNAKDNIKKEIK